MINSLWARFRRAWRTQSLLLRFGRRERITLSERPETIYAIGDVHGRVDLLLRLEAQIIEHARNRPGDKLIIMLGDYIDKGPSSRQVIDHLLQSPPDGFQRICLAGNHEAAMYDCLSLPSRDKAWLRYGQVALDSYNLVFGETAKRSLKLRLMRQAIPAAHIAFLKNLPVLVSVPDYIFVHAGLRPGVSLSAQSDRDLMWIREPFLEASSADFPARIVHGHTPVLAADVLPHRINIDTTAFKTDCLTALVVPADGQISLLQTDAADL